MTGIASNMPFFTRRIAIAILLIFVAGIAALFYLRNHSTAAEMASIAVNPLTSRDHLLGTAGAPIRIILFSDLQCPHCKNFFETTLPRLQAKYGSANMLVAYRHFPLDDSHPQARPEAIAAECVSQEKGGDAFWRYIASVFALTKSDGSIASTTLDDLSGAVGITHSVFDQCKTATSTARLVQADYEDGIAAGISMTPSLVIEIAGSRLLVGGDYYGKTVAAIDYLLQKTNTRL